jgi:hypothetical protein
LGHGEFAGEGVLVAVEDGIVDCGGDASLFQLLTELVSPGMGGDGKVGDVVVGGG